MYNIHDLTHRYREVRSMNLFVCYIFMCKVKYSSFFFHSFEYFVLLLSVIIIFYAVCYAFISAANWIVSYIGSFIACCALETETLKIIMLSYSHI